MFKSSLSIQFPSSRGKLSSLTSQDQSLCLNGPSGITFLGQKGAQCVLYLTEKKDFAHRPQMFHKQRNTTLEHLQGISGFQSLGWATSTSHAAQWFPNLKCINGACWKKWGWRLRVHAMSRILIVGHSFLGRWPLPNYSHSIRWRQGIT